MQRPPKIDGAPGLAWRPRTDGYAAFWIARADLVKSGYRPKTQRLWPSLEGLHAAEPDASDVAFIQSECVRLQDDMLGFARGGAGERGQFDGTITGLSRAYQTDPDSRFHRIRYESRRPYTAHLRAIEANVGARSLATITGRDLNRWYDQWSEAGAHVPRAHARITMLRILVSFGVAILEDKDCIRLRVILDEMHFPKQRPRVEEITASQAIAIRHRAHAIGKHSIALAQAFQFETILRPKDVIGAWLPLSEPGISDVTARGDKWLYGIDWREVSADMILEHRLSKSLHGRHAITDPRVGKVKRFDLKLYPMIMEDLAYVAPDARTGPIIVKESSGLPYLARDFAATWREIATAVGVPPNVQNRDSRAGGISEGIEATDGDMDAVRHAAGHSQIKQTADYSRGADRATAKVAVFRAKKRGGTE